MVYKYSVLTIPQIRQLHIELTTRCNARCPICIRNYRGYEYNSGYPVTELSLQDIQHICQPSFLRQIDRVLLNGNLGDFGLAHEGPEIVKYLVDQGVDLVEISTNGSMRTPEWWASLANPSVVIGFALDGLADTHSLYRQDTDWNRIIENATAYIRAGGRAVWRFIPFDHNRHQEEDCRRLARELGFEQFENIYDGRDRGPVYTRTGEFSHWIGTPGDNPAPIKNLLEHHLTWFDPKTVKNPKDRAELNLTCEHKRQRELYIAADGTVYPCCYLGFYPTTMYHQGNEQLAQLVKENNALHYSLEHCVEWFNQVEESWSRASIANGRTFQCVNNCGH